MTVDLDKLEALAKAATPGPWPCGGPWPQSIRDAQFVAAANPETVLELIDIIRSFKLAMDLSTANTERLIARLKKGEALR